VAALDKVDALVRREQLLLLDHNLVAGITPHRVEIERLAGDLRPRGLGEQIAREVDLDGIEPVLDALLAGEAVGRTVVRLPEA
jgi:hypothetical protein